jgi:glycosyltransferase involved in cell wall biosynthesis
VLQATIIIPTHDHRDMILRAIASIKRQTLQDFEVFVIGDGVPDETRMLMTKACEEDKRFRFFDYPKGQRTGETYRNRALQEANGEIVCYLADDDLWLPNHLEAMLRASEDADFFHSLHAGVNPDGSMFFFPSNLNDNTVRSLMCHTTANRFGLSFCGHTLSAYHALPSGWHTAPEGVPTDLHMWRQFLLQETVRARTVFRVTALGFAAPLRMGWSLDQRLEELDRWLNFSLQDGFLVEIQGRLLEFASKGFAGVDMLAKSGMLRVAGNPG